MRVQDVLKLARQVSEDFVKMSEDDSELKPRGMAEVMSPLCTRSVSGATTLYLYVMLKEWSWQSMSGEVLF